MFTPIKNLITYIQKNASFGSNTAGVEESAKMETENMKPQSDGTEYITRSVEIANDSEEASVSAKDVTKHKYPEMDLKTTPTKTTSSPTTATSLSTTITSAKIVDVPIECEFEDDDIEAQICSSIMLKKPVKGASTKCTEILEVKKSPIGAGSIVISHDFNRNHAMTPIDDELEDFRHDPTEVVTSSPVHHAENTDDACSLYSAEDGKDCSTEFSEVNMEDEICDEKEMDLVDILETSVSDKGNDSTEKATTADSDEDGEQMNKTEDEEDDVGETFLDMDNLTANGEVIVISENSVIANNVIIPLDPNDNTNNSTSDDPLAIACEDQEAFAADKVAALEELNLLNTSANSQDEDTNPTTDDDILWLRSDAAQRNEEPSCSNKSSAIVSVDGATPEKDERNGEGSDSGLGSETSTLHTTATSIADTSQLNTTSSAAETPLHTPNNIQMRRSSEKDSDKMGVSNLLSLSVRSSLKEPPKPLRSNLKRRLEVDDDVVDSLRNITSHTATSTTSAISGNLHKKPKRSINFDNVQVYYFPRQQGFSCVPSAGGCTLGMGARHVGFKTLSLAEHAAELRRAHRMQLQEINPRGSSSDDSEESEEDYLSEGSGSDLDGESNGFLQPVSPKQRRAILKAAGIRKIDTSEKVECRNIRNSREVCGCSCRDFCDPETCACSQSGIKCQVDRDMFPCGCSRDACGNTIGRVEFNPARVRTHFIHTLMRLEMENRQLQNPYSPAAVVPSATTSSYYQSHLQPQSNYSSGYASPAYNTSAEVHQQTAANYYHQQSTSSASSLYGQTNSMEMPLSGSTASTSPAATVTTYGMDSLDSSLFGNAGAAGATPSYGELMPVSSYHHNMNFGSVQTQVPAFNSYHNNVSSYINANANTTALGTPPTYSSCAVPSIPPYGTATTTEATGIYHNVGNLTSLETTTAPSCTNVGSALESDAATSFISLSTPLASSSRLSQINDLLQHNRNATTALVAVSSSSSSSTSLIDTTQNVGSGSYNTTSINTPPIEDAHKSCMAYAAPPPLKPPPIVAVNNEQEPVKLPAPPPPQQQSQPSLSLLTSEMSLSSAPPTITTIAPMIELASSNISNPDFVSQPAACKTNDETTTADTTMTTVIDSSDVVDAASVAAGK